MSTPCGRGISRAALRSSVSHDLRTALSAVMAAADELDHGVTPELIGTIKAESARLNRFVIIAAACGGEDDPRVEYLRIVVRNVRQKLDAPGPIGSVIANETGRGVSPARRRLNGSHRMAADPTSALCQMRESISNCYVLVDSWRAISGMWYGCLASIVEGGFRSAPYRGGVMRACLLGNLASGRAVPSRPSWIGWRRCLSARRHRLSFGQRR